jgi:hypothetical protein
MSTAQLELFSPPTISSGAVLDRDDWSGRCLLDLAAAPVRCCPNGFMGSFFERLVAVGHAKSRADGFFEPALGCTPKQAREWRKRAKESPVSLYEITSAGRAALGCAPPPSPPTLTETEAA